MENEVRIGLFDSGIGGFSVLRACMRLLPDAVYEYYGDLAHAPFGERSREEIVSYTENALEVFEERGVSAVILACNTATAAALGEMRARFSFPVLGVEPAVAPAARRHRRVLVLATPLTASSARLARLLARFPENEFSVLGLRDLAARVEDYFAEKAPLDLGCLAAAPPCDCAVLGCTHYALVAEEIAAYLRVPVYDGAEGTARNLLRTLKIGTAAHSVTTPIFPPKFPIFLGSGREILLSRYETNICFQYLKKFF